MAKLWIILQKENDDRGINVKRGIRQSARWTGGRACHRLDITTGHLAD